MEENTLTYHSLQSVTIEVAHDIIGLKVSLV